jgi:hypothetical protein
MLSPAPRRTAICHDRQVVLCGTKTRVARRGSGDRGTRVRRFPTSGVVIWSPIRKASEYTRFLASVPSLGHLIAETVSSLARSHNGRKLERKP